MRDDQETRAMPGPAWPWRAVLRLTALATVWSAVAYSLGFVTNHVVGVSILLFSLDHVLRVGDLYALYVVVAGLVQAALLAWLGLRKARQAGGGDWHAGLGDRRLAHRGRIAVIAAALTALTAAVVVTGWTPIPGLLPYVKAVSPGMLAVGILVFFVIAPLAQVIFMYGWLWTALRQHVSPVLAGAISSALCLLPGLVYGIPAALSALPLVIAISYARHVGDSLRGSLVVSAAYSGIALLSWLLLLVGLDYRIWTWE